MKTKRYDFMFFAHTRNERDILVHEINALSETKNAEVEVMSARQNVMNDIDPVNAFNAYNLSMSCAPDFKSDHIIVADRRSVHYIRDGYRCYTSKTMRKELFLTDGCVFKEPEKKVHLK